MRCSEEDRVVAGEHGGDAVDETARDGSPYRIRFVASDPTAYDWYYNVVANPTLWFLQHYMWGLPYAPDLDLGLHHAWFNGYLPVNQAFADATIAELEREPGAAVFFHDYHLYLAPKLVRARAPGRAIVHFVHIPWPQSDYWTCCRSISGVTSTRACLRMTSSVSTPSAGSETSCTAARTSSARTSTSPARPSRTTGTTLVTSHPIGVDPAEFDELRRRP